MAGLRPSRAGDLPVGHLVQRGTAPLRPRLRTARRVRTRLVATTGSHPTVRLKQDRRTLRNSGQLSLSDPAQLSRITDTSLCHGWAGLFQTTWRSARDA